MTKNTEQQGERRKPIHLLADSQLLFPRRPGRTLFMESLRRHISATASAAYVGASNGDLPAFYELFVAAMAQIGISNCCHVHAALSPAEAAFLATADLILLAGGDAAAGLRTFQANGLVDMVRQRYEEGCLLLGVSAGAMQLGQYIVVRHGSAAAELLPGLGLIPHLLDAHQEFNGWERLSRTVQTLEGTISGLGIPAGGGLIVHPDRTLEPVHTVTHEFSVTDGVLRHSLLLPAE